MSRALRGYNSTPSVHTKYRSDQVRNNSGGFVYQLDDKSRLERFLILGVDGGTYYVTERDLTQQNVDWLIQLIKRDPTLVLDTVHEVSTSGRAYRNGPAIFTLALVLNHGSWSDKAIAVAIAPEIARTATMVFELAQYIENLGGWGRAKRRAIANWFKSKTPDEIAYQAVKYRQRNGWTLRDLMRLSHPVGVEPIVGDFILGKPHALGYGVDILDGFRAMQTAQDVKGVLTVLAAFPSLPWETIPTQFLTSPEVWKKLFYNNQLRGQAALRNITRLQKIGAFEDRSFRSDFCALISDKAMMEKTRLHPMQYLNASIVYTEGSVNRKEYGWSLVRKKDWTTDLRVVDALKDGFYTSFKTVKPSGKKFLIGLDVSGSMSWSSAIGSDLSAAQASAVMAMMIARVESDSLIYGFADRFVDLGISPNDRFENVMKKVQKNNFGSTNMSLPMKFAKQNRTGSEVFVVITDNEVNRGTQPASELKNYRNTVPGAKLAVMGVTSTGFTIADPTDPGMIDVVGFDSNAPKVISDFAAGRI